MDRLSLRDNTTYTTTFDNISYSFNHSPPEYTQFINRDEQNDVLGQHGGRILRSETRFSATLFDKERDFIEITYSTKNKSGEIKICAKSLFEDTVDPKKSPYHWAYMFTTNDPLNCDNFNKSSKVGKCVEQSAFCEGKAKLALALIRNTMQTEEFERYVWEMVTTRSRFVKNDFLVYILSDMSDFDDPDYGAISKDPDELIRLIKSKLNPQNLAQRYLEYLHSCLYKPVCLEPAPHYKMAGQRVLAIKDYMDEWKRAGLATVTTERNLLQREDQFETELLVGMRARCVIECSHDDDLWGYKHEGGKELKMAWFDTDDGTKFMLKMIEKVVRQQDAFINQIDRHSSVSANEHDEVVKLILNPLHEHKLGLSIRLLQAIYSEEIKIHPIVHGRLRGIMRSRWGLEWNVILPDGLRAHHTVGSIFDLACNIGTPVSHLE